MAASSHRQTSLSTTKLAHLQITPSNGRENMNWNCGPGSACNSSFLSCSLYFPLAVPRFPFSGRGACSHLPDHLCHERRLLLQWVLKYNFSVAVAVGYIALFGIAVETGVVMVVYLHESLERRLQTGTLRRMRCGRGAIEGAVHVFVQNHDGMRCSRKPHPILWESGIGSDVMKQWRSDCRRHDYLHDSRPDLVPVFFVI